MDLAAPWEARSRHHTSPAAASAPHAQRGQPGAPPGLPHRPPVREPWDGGGEEEVPDWWPLQAEFPRWHVWRGVAGLLYARWPRTSPPVVVRAKDPAALREAIISAEAAR